MSADRFKKIAHETWVQFDIERGGRFTSEEYRERLDEELIAQSADVELRAIASKKLADDEEKSHTYAGVPGQLNLLTGEDDELDSFWKIDKKLVKVRYVVRDELLMKLAQEDEDLARKQIAGAKRKRESAELLPYMTEPTTRLEDAKRAWRLDHPPGGES